RARDDCCETGCFRYGDAPHVEKVHQCSYAPETHIVLQTKAREQHFKRDFRIHVTELCTIEVKPDGALRSILHALEPHKLRFRIDEAADEPGRADSVNPHMLPRRPDSTAKVLNVPTGNL